MIAYVPCLTLSAQNSETLIKSYFSQQYSYLQSYSQKLSPFLLGYNWKSWSNNQGFSQNLRVMFIWLDMTSDFPETKVDLTEQSCTAILGNWTSTRLTALPALWGSRKGHFLTDSRVLGYFGTLTICLNVQVLQVKLGAVSCLEFFDNPYLRFRIKLPAKQTCKGLQQIYILATAM